MGVREELKEMGIVRNKKTTIMAAFVLLFIPLIACFSVHLTVNAQTDQASSKLQAANAAVNQAFAFVSAAEKAGANVTGLLNQLNDANNLLAQAENANRNGDTGAAVNDANAVISITRQITTSAQNAKENALTSAQNTFWSTIAITIIAIAVFVLALFAVWRWYKRKYIQGLSNAKPEVIS